MSVTHLSPGLLLAAFVGSAATILLAWFAARLLASERSPMAPPTGSAPTAAAPAASLARTVFSLACGAPSCAVFKPGAGIRISQIVTPLGPVDVELSTGYADGWGHIEYGIMAVAKGSAATEEDQSSALGAALSDLLAALSVSANAWVGDLTALVEDSPSLCVQPEGDQVRELDEEATGAFLDRLGAHPNASGLWKTLHCYRQALAHWTPEEQSVALAKLHEGFLMLSESLIPFLCESRGLTTSEVAKAYGVRQEELQARALEVELYRDDKMCFRSAQVAWQACLPQPGIVAERCLPSRRCPCDRRSVSALRHLSRFGIGRAASLRSAR